MRSNAHIARRAELAGYAMLVLITVAFAMLAGAASSPAAAPVLHACTTDHQVVTAVSSQLGEDLAPMTVLRSSNPHVNIPTGPDRLPNYGATTRDDGRIHVGPHTPCDLVDDVLRHEFVHVLQLRAGQRLAFVDHELVADEIARRWGNTYTPYLDQFGPPGPDQLAHVEALLRDRQVAAG